jgi:hypothetical protein
MPTVVLCYQGLDASVNVCEMHRFAREGRSLNVKKARMQVYRARRHFARRDGPHENLGRTAQPSFQLLWRQVRRSIEGFQLH